MKYEDLHNGICEICNKPHFVMEMSSYDTRLVCAICAMTQPSPFFDLLEKSNFKDYNCYRCEDTGYIQIIGGFSYPCDHNQKY